jgi:intracellular septation protein
MSDTAPSKTYPKWLPAALDYAPLLIFFLGFKFLGVFAGTGVFMVAIIIAIIIGLWKVGRVAPMTWLSAFLIMGFGGLTLWLHDERFIQIKPTAIYGLLSAILFIGLLRGKAMIKYVLEHAMEGVSDRGWMIFSRNWAIFFNEILRANVSFSTWLTVKIWGLSAASLIFSFANLPMLMRHGLGQEETVPPA